MQVCGRSDTVEDLADLAKLLQAGLKLPAIPQLPQRQHGG
jgi:hypothetical protein